MKIIAGENDRLGELGTLIVRRSLTPNLADLGFGGHRLATESNNSERPKGDHDSTGDDSESRANFGERATTSHAFDAQFKLLASLRHRAVFIFCYKPRGQRLRDRRKRAGGKKSADVRRVMDGSWQGRGQNEDPEANRGAALKNFKARPLLVL